MKNLQIYLVALVLISIHGGCSNTDHDKNIQVVKNYVAAVENLDYNAMESFLADQYQGYGPSAGDSIGKADALESWRLNTEDLYESIHYNRSQFAGVTLTDGPNKGDWVSNWAELEIHYQNGDGPVTIWANSNYKIENGKITRSYTFYNEADVLDQLGYVFVHPDNL